jgi:hypothetical protein
MWWTQKIMHYVSDIDVLLEKFDKEHPVLSKSQQKEQKKYQHIYQLRDERNERNQRNEKKDVSYE